MLGIMVRMERTVRAINHNSLLLLLLLQLLLHSLDIISIKVGTTGSTTENDEAVRVAGSLGDGGEALLGDTHEVVLSSCGSNGINSNSQRTISSVLETDWEGEARGQLAVELGLGGTGTDGTERDHVCEELWRDGIKHLRSNWHAHGRQITEELAGDAKPLVDLVRLVDVWVVNQTFPADGGARLLEVGAHDDAEVVGELVGQGLQARAVLQRGGWVVDGAWADDDEHTVVVVHDDVDGIFAAFDHGLEGGFGDWDLGEEKLGWDQWILSEDCEIL